MIRHVMTTLLVLVGLISRECRLQAQTDATVTLQYATSIDRGYGEPDAVVTPYTVFPSELLAPYAGAELTSIRVGLMSKAANVYLYIKQNAADANPLYRQKVGDLAVGWNEIVLDQPFPITGTDTLCLGYKANFRSAEGAGYDRTPSEWGSIVYNNALTRWDHISGSFCIQACLTGNALPTDELAFISLHDATVLPGQDLTPMTAVLENRGCNVITQYQLSYSVDEEEPWVYAYFSAQLQPSQRDTVQFLVPRPGIGTHQVQAEIVSVNGGEDAYAANNHATGILFEPDPSMIRRIVVEEATGEWCGWCPRGLVGLEMMKERHPQDFIAISVHGGDELEIPEYGEFLAQADIFPTCAANRHAWGDPYNDIERLFTAEAGTANHYLYTLSATMDESHQLHTSSLLRVDQSLPVQRLNVAIVVTEDHVEGLYQLNSYAGSDMPMAGWESLPSIVAPVYYDDVARGIYPGYSGTELIHDLLEPGVDYTLALDFPLPASVTDVNRIHVIGLLLDATTGFILNAFSVQPEPVSHLPVLQDTPSDVAPRYYDLMGRQVPAGTPGILFKK